MATDSQMKANKQNSMASTGPRSEEGKGRSSLNSLKHGLRSSMLLMPWESEEEWLAFHDNMMQSLAPDDPWQSLYAELAIKTAWMIQRAARIEMELCSRKLQPAASLPEAAPPQAEACGYKTEEGEASPPQAEAYGYKTEEGEASPPQAEACG